MPARNTSTNSKVSIAGGIAWESVLTMSANGETRYIRELRATIERVKRGETGLRDNRNNPITKADLPELQRMLQKALK